MTTRTLNMPTACTNAMLSLSSAPSLNKKSTAPKKYVSYTFIAKPSAHKPLAASFSADWDLNMNELEFE